MRSKLAVFIFALIFYSTAGQGGTVVRVFDISLPEIETIAGHTLLKFEGTKLLGEPGKATLPFFPVKLLLPPGEVALSIEFQFESLHVLQGDYILMPRQLTRPLSSGENGDWLMDAGFYKSNDNYPSSYHPGVETHFLNGCGIAVSCFTPVRYCPQKKQVSYYQLVTVTIRTIPDPASEEHHRNFFPSVEKARQVAGIVQNPESVAEYYPGRDFRDNGYNYLIITAHQYLNEFDTLDRFYRSRGLVTKVTSKEHIDSVVAGSDLQQKIRNYIIGEYRSNGIEYVLLGGDTNIVPSRGFYCSVQSDIIYSDSTIPADIYYSALDGSWNADGNNWWGEPHEDDLLPEVAVGRMPFSDAAELHNMIHKTLLYQDYPVEGELTKPLLAGEYLYNNPVTYGSDYMRLLVGCRDDNGYTTCGIPPEHPRDTLYDSPIFSWSKEDLIGHINSGRPWLHHCGHASYYSVMKMGNGDITSTNFALVNGVSHNYTIVYTHGCNCGGFDKSDCIGERMVAIDNFAVAFIGNSRYGWFNQGTTDGPSEHLHREFVDALYHDSLFRAGTALMKSKAETAPFVKMAGEFEPGATRWCFYDNNLLGDPAMAMWTEEPCKPEADYPAYIPAGSDSVIVHLSGSCGFYGGLTCSIFRNNTLFGTSSTNAAGSAVIRLSDELPEGKVFLNVSGFNILPGYYDIRVSNIWLGYTTEWYNLSNWATGVVPGQSSYVIIPAAPEGRMFPVIDSGENPQIEGIYIEPGALVNIGTGNTLNVGGD
jgi:hypothetical protein